MGVLKQLHSFFPKTVRLIGASGLPDRGQVIMLSERSEGYEAQVKDQCFEGTADGRHRYLS